jgi:hypothetical protein
VVLHEYTISALGHLAGYRERETAKLGLSAVEGAGMLLDRHGGVFQARMAVKGFENLKLHWKSEDYSCALATFSADEEVLSAAVIMSGLRPEADAKVRGAAQGMIESFCRAAGEPASDGLMRADKRPMVACIRWSTKDRKGMSEVRDLEVCLAAAFLARAFDNVKWLML